MDESEKAIDAAMNVTSEGDEYHVINYHPEFLSGELYVVGFETDDGPKNVFVYMEKGKPIVCKNQALLNELVARKSKKTGFQSVLESLGGIAGVIGVLITVTIIYIVLRDPKAEIPQVLSAALTTILGFYFGSKINK
ncbi:MAG: hypothetical protein ABW152_18490 [Candidatus Thiodiazotropha endolucinida]